MQQYFIKGQVENPVIIKDKDTVKHMFNVMRLTEDDQVVLVFEDGIKRLARVTDRENHVFEVIEDLTDIPVIALVKPNDKDIDIDAKFLASLYL